MDVVEDPGAREGPLHRALADPRRRALAELIAAASAPLDARELGAALKLHPNTVRWHLGLLEQAGLVAPRTLPATGRGRPRVGWVAVRRSGPAAEYRMLAALLAGSLAGAPDGTERARAAGSEWGAYLVQRPEPGTALDAAAAQERLVDLLDRHGFKPASEPAATGGGGPAVALHACPFLDIAQAHGAVVCGAHRGLVEGALAELGGALVLDGLEPFARPGTCLVHLRAGGAV